MRSLPVYLLIDSAMIDSAIRKPWLRRERRAPWIQHFYDSDAQEVTPLLIDLHLAHKSNGMSLVMALLNARMPQLHASILETYLPLSELIHHFHRYTYFVAEDGEEMTLRLADCAVLPSIRKVLTPPQWAALSAPISRWLVHGRDGTLYQLEGPSDVEPAKGPIVLRNEQISNLRDAHRADQVLANLRAIRPTFRWAPDEFREYQLASAACVMWESAGQSDMATLTFFVRAVFETKGQLLNAPGLAGSLTSKDLPLVRENIRGLVSQHLVGVADEGPAN